MVKYLLSLGADPFGNDCAALLSVCGVHFKDDDTKAILNILMSFSCSKDILNRALIQAGHRDCLETFELLLSKGADPYFEEMACLHAAIAVFFDDWDDSRN